MLARNNLLDTLINKTNKKKNLKKQIRKKTKKKCNSVLHVLWKRSNSVLIAVTVHQNY